MSLRHVALTLLSVFALACSDSEGGPGEAEVCSSGHLVDDIDDGTGATPGRLQTRRIDLELLAARDGRACCSAALRERHASLPGAAPTRRSALRRRARAEDS